MQQPKEDRYTLADAMTWNEDERTELISGLPVMMAPPSRIHRSEEHTSELQSPWN